MGKRSRDTVNQFVRVRITFCGRTRTFVITDGVTAEILEFLSIARKQGSEWTWSTTIAMMFGMYEDTEADKTPVDENDEESVNYHELMDDLRDDAWRFSKQCAWTEVPTTRGGDTEGTYVIVY